MVALAGGFLFAQAVVLVHQTDLDAHEAGQACEVCLVASVLGGANFATAYSVSTSATPVLNFAEPARQTILSAPYRFQARAPPLAS